MFLLATLSVLVNHHILIFIIQFPVASIGIVLTLFVSGVITTRVYFLRRTLNETDKTDYPDLFNENANANAKGCAKCFPYVNYWARSVLDLTSMYVSAILIHEVFLGLFLGVLLGVFLGVSLGVFLGVSLGVFLGVFFEVFLDLRFIF